MNGTHLIADCEGCSCDIQLLLDAERLRKWAVHETKSAGLTIVGEKFHAFRTPEGAAAGVTCALLLAESHVAIHTWPERRAVTLDVYVCNYSGDNTAKAQLLFDALIAVLSPARVNTHHIRRGSNTERLLHSADVS